MTTLRISRSFLVALLVPLGCDPKDDGEPTDDAGGSTTTQGVDAGDEAGDGLSDDGSHPACLESTTVLEADAVSALGFSAAAMLEGKLGTRKSELAFATEPTFLSLEIAGRVLPFEVTLAWNGGEVRWVESELDPDYDWGGQLGGFPECQDRLEVDVALSLATEGGELDENLSTTLVARSLERAELTGSSISTVGTDLYPPELQGSLDPAELFDDPDVDVLGLVFTGTWHDDLAGGALMVEIRGGPDHGDGGWFGFGHIASWGDEVPWADDGS